MVFALAKLGKFCHWFSKLIALEQSAVIICSVAVYCIIFKKVMHLVHCKNEISSHMYTHIYSVHHWQKMVLTCLRSKLRHVTSAHANHVLPFIIWQHVNWSSVDISMINLYYRLLHTDCMVGDAYSRAYHQLCVDKWMNQWMMSDCNVMLMYNYKHIYYITLCLHLSTCWWA